MRRTLYCKWFKMLHNVRYKYFGTNTQHYASQCQIVNPPLDKICHSGCSTNPSPQIAFLVHEYNSDTNTYTRKVTLSSTCL